MVSVLTNFRAAMQVNNGLLDFITADSYGNLLCTCKVVRKGMAPLNGFIDKSGCQGLKNPDNGIIRQCTLGPTCRLDGSKLCGNHFNKKNKATTCKTKQKQNKATVWSVPVSVLVPKIVIADEPADPAAAEAAEPQVDLCMPVCISA